MAQLEKLNSVSSPQLLSPSLFSWLWPSEGASLQWSSSSSSSCPAGGAREGDRDNWTETKRLPAKREKIRQRGKNKSKDRRRGGGGTERRREDSNASLSFVDSGDQGMWCSFLGDLGLFSKGTLHFLPSSLTTVFGSQIWNNNRQLSLRRIEWGLCLSVEKL